MDKNTKIWLMRQAGRYLPEYREIRKKEKDFMNLCFNPQIACEISLQPIRRFNFDYVILFSDILVIPFALGQEVKFKERLGPILGDFELDKFNLNVDESVEYLKPIFETIKLIKEQEKKKDLIGFCGGPFTVLNYMIEKGTSQKHEKIIKFIRENTEQADKLTDIITELSIEYLKKQIDSGVDYVKIFDSWAGLLKGKEYNRYIIEPNKRISEEINKYSPKTMKIFFPRGSNRNYLKFIKEVKPNVIALDNNFPEEVFSFAKKNDIVLQGNLNPSLLLKGGKRLKEQTKKILKTFECHKHIFNLSHGVLPQTPLENVEKLVETVRNFYET